ncbi:hypothetical protein BH11PSE4_BH11PSE4_33840 [soil metagenome]
MASMSLASDPPPVERPEPGYSVGVFYFDGTSSIRHTVALRLGDSLEIWDNGLIVAAWRYADTRRADSPQGMLRVSCLTAPVLARLEIRDDVAATEVIARCPQLDATPPASAGSLRSSAGRSPPSCRSSPWFWPGCHWSPTG